MGGAIESMSAAAGRRPKSVAVAALLLAVWGGISLARLPVADYPEVAPTLVSVSTTYSGASPQVVADTVATPIENEITPWTTWSTSTPAATTPAPIRSS